MSEESDNRGDGVVNVLDDILNPSAVDDLNLSGDLEEQQAGIALLAKKATPEEIKSKPYECMTCGKRYRKSKRLLKHRRTAHGEMLEDPSLGPIDRIVSDDGSDEPSAEPEPQAGVEPEGLKVRKPRAAKEKALAANGENGDDDDDLDDDDEDEAPRRRRRKRPPTRKATPSSLRRSDASYKCKKCDLEFTRAMALRDHKKTHKIETKFQCRLCNEEFHQWTLLYKHSATHGEGSYRCMYCEKIYTKLDELVKHDRYHNGGIKYTCKACGKSYPQKWNLKHHLRLHTGDHLYQCEHCGKCCSNVSNYKSHMRTHTGEKPYVCDTCGKCFREGGHLVKHKRVHTGEKPYHCKVCSACFSDSSKLARHTKTQHNAFGKEYSCGQCGKCFSRVDQLHTHEKIHTGERVPRKRSSKPSTPKRPPSMAPSEPSYHRYELEQHHDNNTNASATPDEVDQSNHTIEILLAQRLNQNDEPHNLHNHIPVTYNQAVPMNMHVPMSAHHPMQVQMQPAPNVLNQFANVVDGYAMHYPSFFPRK